MIKNKFKKLIVASAIITAPLMADNSAYLYDVHSLVGIEGGYSSLSYENGTSANNEQYSAKL